MNVRVVKNIAHGRALGADRHGFLPDGTRLVSANVDPCTLEGLIVDDLQLDDAVDRLRPGVWETLKRSQRKRRQ